MEKIQDIGARAVRFAKAEPVFSVALAAALLSMIAVPPNPAYFSYIKWRTLGLLLMFMLCVAGMQKAGLFNWFATGLLRGVTRSGTTRARTVCAVLVLMPFVCAMCITNDVSLLTFVPFAILLLEGNGRRDLIPLVLTFQTIAANAGSYLTPFGNPHNLYTFTLFDVTLGEFVAANAPFTCACGVLLAVCVACFARGVFEGAEEAAIPTEGAKATGMSVRDAILFVALFALSVLSVVKILPLWVALIVVVVATLARDRRLFARVDWLLLGTFVCFFIFSSNLAAIPAVNEALTGAMDRQPFWITLIASQVISNVPACTLLAPFTTDWCALAVGANLGGLGSPVGSLASLITIGFYRRQCGNVEERSAGENAKTRDGITFGRFMRTFLVFNFAFLALMCLLWLLLHG